MTAPARAIGAEERFPGERVVLRLATLADCGERYLGWLRDPSVNRWLETRWCEQTLASIRAFVAAQLAAADSYLFAIEHGGGHIGNLRLGPIHPIHQHADVSYFIGERSCWGRGLATDAIRTACGIAFGRLGLHRVQAGLYAANVASARALEKAGFACEGRFRAQLRSGDGWDDHCWYGRLAPGAEGGTP